MARRTLGVAPRSRRGLPGSSAELDSDGWQTASSDEGVLNALRCLEEGLRRVAVCVALRYPLGVLFPLVRWLSFRVCTCGMPEHFVIETVRERLSPEHFERYPVNWDRL
jgi:hypothetical protein